MFSPRLLIPFAFFISGMLAERYGNISFFVAGIGMAIGIALLWLNSMQSPLKQMRSYARVLVLTGVAAVFGSLGILAAVISPRESESDAMRVSSYREWRSRLTPDSRVTILVKRVYAGEYGDILKGVVAESGQWQGWGITSFCGATGVESGDLVSVPSRSLQGGFARSKEVVILEKKSERSRIDNLLHNKLITAIEATRLATYTKSMLRALIAGDTESADGKFRTTLADAGLAHMLALSGMHIAIAASLILILLWPLKLWGLWKLRLFLAVVLTWLYVVASGLSGSAVRAAVMLTCAVFAIVAERKRSVPDALLIAAFLILLFNPDSIFKAGFQLSFLCVAALFFFVEPLNPISRRLHKHTYAFVNLLLVPMVAFGASWIVGAYYFGRIPMGFLALNLIAVPLLPLYLNMAAFYILLASFGIEPLWLRHVLDEVPCRLAEGAEFAGSGTVIDFRPEWWMVVVWIALLAWAAFRLRRAIPK